MTPAVYTFPPHYKGDTFNSFTFTIKENGVPIDLTGASVKIEFKKKSIKGDIQASMTVGSGITIDDAEGGVLRLDSFINDWLPENYFYDTQITFANGIVNTYFKGVLTVNQDITNG
tara:strand:- start:2855 stop:3202 length:348 start_codon:yes stop_codon:yes gene_type:complete